MLPDFCRLQALLEESLLDLVREVLRTESPARTLPSRRRAYEGDDSVIQNADGDDIRLSFKEVASSLVLERSRLKVRDVPGLYGDLFSAVSELDALIERQMFERLANSDKIESIEVSESLGNLGSALIEAFKKLPLSFCPLTQQPFLPTIAVHPQNAHLIFQALSHVHEKTSTSGELQKILDIKKEEWLARESDRELVD